MIPVPLIAFPIALLAALMLSGGTGYWAYEHGIAIQEARQTKAELVQERKDREDERKNIIIANNAGKKLEDDKPRIIREVHERTRDIVIPPDADPYMPVWLERVFNNLASPGSAADTDIAQPPGGPGTLRLSASRPLLEAWVTKYETCRRQLAGIRELNPVLPAPKEAEKSILDIF